MEVNCDDSLDVMKRLRERRAVIIRDNRHDREGGGGWGGSMDRRKCNRIRDEEEKRETASVSQ